MKATCTVSSIQWTDETWNPTTGCTKISPGCANCYIETTIPFRTAGRKFVKGRIPLILHGERLDKPLHWKRPRRVFVNSLSDLFHCDVPDSFIDDVFRTMHACPQHTFQVLTKRPERMKQYVSDRWNFNSGKVWLPIPNVWLGVSVEDQQRADERIPLLLQTPAAVRFLSCEPLLGEISLSFKPGTRAHLPGWLLEEIDWCIVGGESGPNARPCNVAWVRSIVRQCKAAGVACFVKQLGASPYRDDPKDRLNIGPTGVVTQDGESRRRRNAVGEEFSRTKALMILGDKKGGDPAEWPEDLRVREFPARSAV
jgi:protein gp37